MTYKIFKKMEGKEKIPDYLSLYKDLTSKIIDTMLPNLNLNPAYNLGKNNAQQVFSQYEVAYIVENICDLDERTAWSRVPSLIKNLKTYNYAKINVIHLNSSTIVLEDLLKKVNIAVEMDSEKAIKISDLDEIVKTVLLLTAVLKKIDENITPKVLIVNEEVRTAKSTDFDKYDDCNEDYESLDEDFKVENRPFSQSMASFLVLRDGKKDKKKKRKRRVNSIDAALEGIIKEVETSMDKAKNISEYIGFLNVVDPAAVLNKAQELKEKLEAVKLKCDEFVNKFLDGELKRITEDAVNLGEDAEKPDLKQTVVPDGEAVETLQVEIVSKAECSKETVSKAECSKETISRAESLKETVSKAECSIGTVSEAECSKRSVLKGKSLKETVSKAESLNETVSNAECSRETVPKAKCLKETVVSIAESSKEVVSKAGSSKVTVPKAKCSKETVSKVESSKDIVEMSPHGIEMVSNDQSTNLNIKSPSNLRSLNTTDETIEGSADQTFVIDDRIQSIETTSETNKPVFKVNTVDFLKMKSQDSKSSVESICSEMSNGDCNMSKIINKALRKKNNRIHALVESNPGTNTVFCPPCNVEFTVTHLNMREHIYTSQHLDSLGEYYLDIQSKLLETYPNILKTFELSASALWNDRIFIDPSMKLSLCVSCRTALQYTTKAIRSHINTKAHIAEVFCMKERVRKINLHDERISTLLRGNRIMIVPIDGDTLSCIPCDTELSTSLYDVVRHAESTKHQNTLDEYNYKVQKEIIKANLDLFGFGKQYPLTEKHLRQDKLFVNPVADFAYCGICRKPVILNDIQHNILKHLTIEEHAVNFELSRRFRDTFEEVSELGKIAAPKTEGVTPPIVENIACDNSEALASKPVSLKRRFDETDSISQENLPSDLWYIPLEHWIQKEDGEDASEQTVLTLTDVVKMKKAAFTDLQLIAPKTTAKKSHSPPVDSAEDKKNLKQQIKRLSIINRLVKNKPDLKCDPCRIVIPKDLNRIQQHVGGIEHVVKLCQFNAKLQRVTISRFPLVFVPSSPYSMTDVLIEKDTIFIDPLRKLIFCGCCTAEIKYSRRSIKSHVYSPNHANRRSIYLSELNKITAAQDGASKMQESPGSFSKHESESSSFEIEESFDDNDETKSSTDVNSDEVSRSSSITEISEKITCTTCDIRDIPNQKCFAAHLKGKTHRDNLKLLEDPKSAHAKERKLLSDNMICLLYGHVPPVYTCNACKGTATYSIINAVNHAKTTEHVKALKAFKMQLKPDKENSPPLVLNSNRNNVASSSKQMGNAGNLDGNEKQHVVDTKNSNNDKQKQCTNVDNANINAAPVERYGMDSRLIKGRINENYEHIYIYIVKTGNNYRCVDCDYNGIISVPMAFAHLRSCFHNPVVVEGVQYLKEANYHCIVCKAKIYGIKDVVDHIAHTRHKEKLKHYY